MTVPLFLFSWVPAKPGPLKYRHSAQELEIRPASRRWQRLTMLETGAKTPEESADRGNSKQNTRSVKMNRIAGFTSFLGRQLTPRLWNIGYGSRSYGAEYPSSDNTKMNQRDRDPNEPTADKPQNGDRTATSHRKFARQSSATRTSPPMHAP